jgi:hypothetical protein
MSRTVEAMRRGAEILNIISPAEGARRPPRPLVHRRQGRAHAACARTAAESLRNAHRQAGIFLHHDAITGKAAAGAMARHVTVPRGQARARATS